METANERIDECRILSFSLGTEEYAMPLLAVKEVIALPEVTAIPFTPSHFLGIMNLRGQVISVIDLRLKFGLKPGTGAETSVIICDLGVTSIGVVVDSINSVLLPKPEELSPAPKVRGGKAGEYISQVYKSGDRLVVVIDVDRSIGSEDASYASKASQQGGARSAA